MKTDHHWMTSGMVSVLALLTSLSVLAAEPQALEVVISQPNAGVTMEKLVEVDKKMETDFVSKQPGFIKREVAVSKDGNLFVIVHWKTLKAAEAAGKAFETAPSAAERMAISKTSLFNHYVLNK